MLPKAGSWVYRCCQLPAVAAGKLPPPQCQSPSAHPGLGGTHSPFQQARVVSLTNHALPHQTLKLLLSTVRTSGTHTETTQKQAAGVKAYPASTGRTTKIHEHNEWWENLTFPLHLFMFNLFIWQILCALFLLNYLKGFIYLCEHRTTVTKAKGWIL